MVVVLEETDVEHSMPEYVSKVLDEFADLMSDELPKTSENKLAKGKKYFTKVDLQSMYWQIRIANDEVKTIVVTSYGSFEFLVMHFWF